MIIKFNKDYYFVKNNIRTFVFWFVSMGLYLVRSDWFKKTEKEKKKGHVQKPNLVQWIVSTRKNWISMSTVFFNPTLHLALILKLFESSKNPHYTGRLSQHISARVLWCFSSFHLSPSQIFPKMCSEADVRRLWSERRACQCSLPLPCTSDGLGTGLLHV